jgi:hypothetical protein
MRQSLSARTSPVRSHTSAPVSGVVLALIAAMVLALVGVLDQLGGQSLMDHASEMYAPHGKDPSAGLLYGLLYVVAATQGVLWMLVLRSARTGGRWAALYAAVVVLIGGCAASALLGSQEYGEQIFPPLWGVLALLSPVAGVVALVQLIRARTP